jgi:endonuclease/exonuclease/phosphatase family metal-dependent hydrolase
MKSSHKIFTSVVTLLVVMSAIACAKRTRAEIKTTAPAHLPGIGQLKTLTAVVRGAKTAATQILLNANSPQHTGLSSSFSFNPNDATRQHLGLVESLEKLNFTAEAVLPNGQRSGCELSKKKQNLLSSVQAHSYVLNCTGHTLELEIDAQSPQAAPLAARTLQDLLFKSAGVFLHDRSHASHKAELVVRQQSLFVSESAAGRQSQFSVGLSAEQINTLNLPAGELQLTCPRSRCGEANATLSLTRTSDGGISLTLPRAAHDSHPSAGAAVVYERAGADALRVASYNVENFWDDVAENSDAYDDFSAQRSDWYSEGFAAKKARRIRDALLIAGLPDVVGLQEIESAANRSRSLELLKPLLATLGYNYYALGLQGEDNPTAVTTAFISKYPIIENHRLDFRFDSEQLTAEEREDFINASRDPQRVTVGLPEGIGLTLLNSHWKSKRDKSPLGDVMRQKIGELMHDHLQLLAKSHGRAPLAMIMGDFNADYRESSVQNGLRLAPTLSMARQSDAHLFNLWQTRPPEGQGDYPHDGELTAIDNMVVTRSLLTDSPLVLAQPLFVAGEFGIAAKLLRNGDFLPFRSQRLQIKDDDGTLRTFHRDHGYSDHLPLIAELKRSGLSSANISARIFDVNVENQQVAQLRRVAVPAATCQEPEIRSADSSALTDVLSSSQRGDCLLIQARLTLRKTGLHNVAFDLDARENLTARERIVILSADRAFAQNKQWLRSTLQQSAGKVVTRIRGRVGMIDGVKAIFISEPTTDIAFED